MPVHYNTLLLYLLSRFKSLIDMLYSKNSIFLISPLPISSSRVVLASAREADVIYRAL